MKKIVKLYTNMGFILIFNLFKEFGKKLAEIFLSILCIVIIGFSYKWAYHINDTYFTQDQVTNEIQKYLPHQWSQAKIIKTDLRGYGDEAIIVFTGLPQGRENGLPNWTGSNYYPTITVFEKKSKNPIENLIFPNDLYGKRFFIQPMTIYESGSNLYKDISHIYVSDGDKYVGEHDTMELTGVKLINNGTPHIIFQWQIYGEFIGRKTYLGMLRFSHQKGDYEVVGLSCNGRACHDMGIITDMESVVLKGKGNSVDFSVNILGDSAVGICEKNQGQSILIIKNDWINQLENGLDHNSNTLINVNELIYNDSAQMYTNMEGKELNNIDTNKTSVKTLAKEFNCNNEVMLLDGYYWGDGYTEMLAR